MDKDEMVRVLQENGYPAENVDGVVYVRKPLTRAEVKDLTALFKKYGYNSSHGHQLRPGEAMEVPPLSLSQQRRSALSRGKRKEEA